MFLLLSSLLLYSPKIIVVKFLMEAIAIFLVGSISTFCFEEDTFEKSKYDIYLSNRSF